MSKAGRILIIGGLAFWAALYAFRLAYGGWHPALWVPLVLGFVLLAIGLGKDWKSILAFFTMRTTKHGLNMGAVILIALIGLTCLNILSVKYNHKFDWTSDKLNSLSQQSVKTAQGLSQETELVLLYRADDPAADSAQKQIKELAGLYLNVGPKLSYESHNVIVDPASAKPYDYSSGPYALFAKQGDRKLRIEPVNEEGVTRALIKLGLRSRKVIYFTMGHGERDLDSKEPDGLGFLKEQLSVTYDVRALTLYQTGNKVPEDAAAVAVIRPMQQFLDPEIRALREFVQLRKGRLLLALDPGMKQNLSGLARSFGIEFHNDYVIDLRSQAIKMGPATVLGSRFPDNSDITKGFPEGTFALFHIVSSLAKSPDTPQETKVLRLIESDERTMSTNQMGQVEYKPNGPHVLAMLAKSGESEVAVFGDSDFLSNALIQQNENNDLSLNTFAELTNDKELISIRPRQAKGTKLEMTLQSFHVYIFLVLIPLPILMFLAGAWVYFRRRTA